MARLRRGYSFLSLSMLLLGATLIYLYAGTEIKRPELSTATNGSLSGWTQNLGSSDAPKSISPSTTNSEQTGNEQTYLRHLVVPKMRDEQANWLYEEDLAGAIPKIYVPDDPSAALTVPANKGHEAMVYLTYIIDHYQDLPDVAIFMHSHRFSWHSPAIFDYDTVETVRHLSSSRVIREGYMNLRCEWDPGCPDGIRLNDPDPESVHVEGPHVAQAWGELFPHASLPDALAQPCCAQFAVSRESILRTPIEEYLSYRDWLIKTDFDDMISGRVFEYVWQYIFVKHAVFCPETYTCYCEGFGMCFEDRQELADWSELRLEADAKEIELEEWHSQASQAKLDGYRKMGDLTEIESLELKIPAAAAAYQLKVELEQLKTVMQEGRRKAIERGKDPASRASMPD